MHLLVSIIYQPDSNGKEDGQRVHNVDATAIVSAED
jgi:hypothetical protein